MCCMQVDDSHGQLRVWLEFKDQSLSGSPATALTSGYLRDVLFGRKEIVSVPPSSSAPAAAGRRKPKAVSVPVPDLRSLRHSIVVRHTDHLGTPKAHPCYSSAVAAQQNLSTMCTHLCHMHGIDGRELHAHAHLSST